MENSKAYIALSHVCSHCANRHEWWRHEKLRDAAELCPRAHYLTACADTIKPLLRNAGRLSSVYEAGGILQTKWVNYGPRGSQFYPIGSGYTYGERHLFFHTLWLDFECLLLETSISSRRHVLCAEVCSLLKQEFNKAN
jgi:hypothetical protein